MAAAVQQAPYLGPSSSTNEWIETQAEDERFLPTFQDDASLITEGLWLGSEANVREPRLGQGRKNSAHCHDHAL